MRSSIRAVSVPRLLMFLLSGEAGLISAQQRHDLDSEPLRWTTIEIVTNDFDSVQRLRDATGIRPGALLAISDTRVQQACDLVKREVPAKIVRCTTFTGGKVDGYVEAEYIVEIINRELSSRSAPLHCSTAELAPDLIALRDHWGHLLATTVAAGESPVEQVNADRYLDYKSPTRHQLAMRIHAIVGARVLELEKATASCMAESRAGALYLMNFTGTPARAIRSASGRMTDPDPDVRNAATRLLGVFSDFISKSEIASIVQKACSATISGGFADRNKSLILLDRMRLRGLISFQALDAKCRGQIQNIARTSTAIQTGVAAQNLAGSAEDRARK